MYCSFDTFEDWLKFWEDELNKPRPPIQLIMTPEFEKQWNDETSKLIEDEKEKM